MDHNDLAAVWVTFGMFGGTALIIWTSMQAKIARIKAEAQARREAVAPAEDTAVLAQLKAIQQQMAQMQSTSHQFDISFDEALGRLEGRINRLETKSAVGTVQTTDAPQTLRNGQSQ